MAEVPTLGDLFPGLFAAGEAARAVAGLTADSRAVKPGFVFVAVPGVKADGMGFAAAAGKAGAVAAVGQGSRPADLDPAVAYAQVGDPRHALALAAARFFPRQPQTIVAVTGTAGKSSVAEFARQIFASLGHPAASLGTIGVVAPKGAVYGSLTTPGPVSLHKTLDALAGDGVTHLSMEASSHGLDQRRLDGVRLTAGGFTNLGRDHLDYHADLEDYLKAKLRLFDALLPEGATAVVNADDAFAGRVIETAHARGLKLLTVGRAGADIVLLDAVREGFTQRVTVSLSGTRRGVLLPLAGAFQVSNALVALGLAIAAGAPAERAFDALASLSGVKGRLERVAEVNGALCIVDYAHKPDALREVLATLRPYATSRLICVFGCGGDRDRGKRPLMGAIAAELADVVIVTDDNPRSEDPSAIRREIMAAAPGAREIGDRGAAIAAAVADLRPGDVLVVAGKGHEPGQTVGSVTLPFSDHEALRAALHLEPEDA